jgi:hypothetical protein
MVQEVLLFWTVNAEQQGNVKKHMLREMRDEF